MSALLPADDTAWPPPSVATRYRNMEAPLAWYSGDPARLRRAYGTRRIVRRTTMRAGGGIASSVSTSESSQWAEDPVGEVDTRRHLPLAEDIAQTSAALLFADPPTVEVVGPMVTVRDAAGNEAQEPAPVTVATQMRLDRILEACNFHGTLLAAAEISAAAGSTGLRIAFDKASPAIGGRPVITRVDADAVIPHYQWGQLVAVTFWQEVDRKGADSLAPVWRHLELHEGGKVYHALYEGSGDNLGKRRPLEAKPATARLAQLVDAEGAIVIDAAGGRTATSVPNMLPDPLNRSDYGGRSDLTPAVMDLLDAADKAYSQLMDSVDDARSRLFISESILERGAPGEGQRFDPRQRVYTKVKMPPSETENGKLPIEKVQFEMHVQEYLELIEALSYKAMDAAGYNPQTQRDDAGAAMTATEYAGRNRKSMTTRDKKLRHWTGELAALLTTLLAVDVAQFGPLYEMVDGQAVAVQALPVRVTFPEAVQPTLIELANVAQALKAAGAASTEVLVRIVHPDWDDKTVGEEVDRITSAASVVDPVSFGSGGIGLGAGDGA